MHGVTTIDCHYLGQPEFAAAYLIREGDRATFVETNTQHALPLLLESLKSQGLKPDDVDYVIVTHAHLDHAGGASALMEACPGATLLCHPRAQRHLVDPSKLVRSAEGVYGAAQFREMYGEIRPIPEARTRAMGDGEALSWGTRTLTFLHTRGHANHHFCVQDSGSQGIFTGDSFGLAYPALQGGGLVAVPSTSPTDFDGVAAREVLKRIVNTGVKRAYLTHFGVREDLPQIAQALDAQLARYQQIFDEAMTQNIPDDALDAHCTRGVARIFGDVLESVQASEQGPTWTLLATDIDLNAQGVAFAVRKARHKAQSA